ncbi:hypothetical protein [Flavisolibacter ginsenosidimutans]|uniref:DUF4136 domain-containing protein n=1 Tax=Flavisolibacter ginsenosidimutans TaxID=661481 RepID=A0A5B8UHY0_9BACT|nr:hypothetical protein [Flavisolibacter ginsenosidimutans]QEC55966.1 hypothetical protein FSB75_08680 [Flavisolibacter ginsenosidimutans]
MKQKLFAALASIMLFSCGPQIYKSADFSNALSKHKTVAILPAEVSMQLRPNQAKSTTPEQMEEMTVKTGYDVQEKMYGWFLRRSDKYHYTVSFQDVTRTNAKLKEAGITYKDLKTTDRSKLAQLLGVDAVMQDRLSMEKPMSEGAAVAVGLLVGAWGNTNKVATTINIHDGNSGNLLWKYDYEAAGSVGSSTTRLVDALMRNATKKFPYSVN